MNMRGKERERDGSGLWREKGYCGSGNLRTTGNKKE